MTDHKPATSRKSADAEDPRGTKCATPHCTGYRDQHATPGNTCWCKIDCPCTAYAASRADIKAREARRNNDANDVYTDEELSGLTVNSEVIPDNAHFIAAGAATVSGITGGVDAVSVDGTGGDSTTAGSAGLGSTATTSGTTTAG